MTNAALRRLRTLDPARAAFALHLASLVFAFGFLLYVNRHQWFNGDEWGPLAYRRLVGGHGFKGMFDPVGGAHWGTLTILSYRLLFTVFGARTYFPYVVVMVAFQVLAAHLLWRVALRARVDPLVATVGAAVFGVLAAGYSILTQAAGLYQTGAVALGLAAVLVAPDEGPLGRRDAAAALLALGSLLFFSGVGIPMLFVLALRLLLTRGVKVAAAVVALPAFALLLWLVTYLPKASRNIYGDPFGEIVRKTPELAWRGLVAAVDQTTGLPGIGPVILVLAFGWAVHRAVLRTAPWPLLLAVTAGGLLYLPLIALGRSGLGVEAATASRYLYTIVAFMLPILLAAAASSLAPVPLRVGTIAVLGVALMVVQVTALNRVAGDRATAEQHAERSVLATVRILHDGDRVTDTFRLLAPIIPLSVHQIRDLAADGAFPDQPAPTRRDVLDARLFLQAGVSAKPLLPRARRLPSSRVRNAQLEAAAPGCRAFRTGPVRAVAILRFESPGSLALLSEREAKASFELVDPETKQRTGRRSFRLVAGEQFFNFGTTKAYVLLVLPIDDVVQLCVPAG